MHGSSTFGLRRSSRGKFKKDNICYPCTLGLLQMVSETRGDVLARRLALKGVDTRQCASKDVGSQKGALKMVDGEIPHWFERRTEH